MTVDIIFNGIMCLAALWFAKLHSIDAFKCAVAFAGGWIFYVSSWLPYGFSPAMTLYAMGFDVTSLQLWCLSDCIVGLIIASYPIPTWARITLWLSFTIQVAFHIMRLNDIFDFAMYSSILDRIFILQIAVFLVLGWPNVRECLSGFVDRWRRNAFGSLGTKAARLRSMEEKVNGRD